MTHVKEELLKKSDAELRQIIEKHDIKISVPKKKHETVTTFGHPTPQESCIAQHSGQCGFCDAAGGFTGC